MTGANAASPDTTAAAELSPRRPTPGSASRSSTKKDIKLGGNVPPIPISMSSIGKMCDTTTAARFGTGGGKGGTGASRRAAGVTVKAYDGLELIEGLLADVGNKGGKKAERSTPVVSSPRVNPLLLLMEEEVSQASKMESFMKAAVPDEYARQLELEEQEPSHVDGGAVSGRSGMEASDDAQGLSNVTSRAHTPLTQHWMHGVGEVDVSRPSSSFMATRRPDPGDELRGRSPCMGHYRPRYGVVDRQMPNVKISKPVQVDRPGSVQRHAEHHSGTSAPSHVTNYVKQQQEEQLGSTSADFAHAGRKGAGLASDPSFFQNYMTNPSFGSPGELAAKAAAAKKKFQEQKYISPFYNPTKRNASACSTSFMSKSKQRPDVKQAVGGEEWPYPTGGRYTSNGVLIDMSRHLGRTPIRGETGISGPPAGKKAVIQKPEPHKGTIVMGRATGRDNHFKTIHERKSGRGAYAALHQTYIVDDDFHKPLVSQNPDAVQESAKKVMAQRSATPQNTTVGTEQSVHSVRASTPQPKQQTSAFVNRVKGVPVMRPPSRTATAPVAEQAEESEAQAFDGLDPNYDGCLTRKKRGHIQMSRMVSWSDIRAVEEDRLERIGGDAFAEVDLSAIPTGAEKDAVLRRTPVVNFKSSQPHKTQVIRPSTEADYNVDQSPVRRRPPASKIDSGMPREKAVKMYHQRMYGDHDPDLSYNVNLSAVETRTVGKLSMSSQISRDQRERMLSPPMRKSDLFYDYDLPQPKGSVQFDKMAKRKL